MKHKLISNCHPIFPIGLGAMPLSIPGRPTTDNAYKVIQTFCEMGGNFIDTADVYGLDDSDRGHNEKLIHDVIKQIGADQMLIATKGGATRPNGGWGFRGGGHPKKLRHACETSLMNLALSTIDLYYLHGPDPDVPLEDSLGELIQLKNEGKIKNIGIANVNLSEITFASKLTTIAAVQNRCNTFCKEDFKNGVIAFCQSNEIMYIPYCPFGGWMDHAKLSRSVLFNYFTKKYAVSTYEICLAWLINKADHIVPIPGMEKADHVRENFHSIQVKLELADLHKIDEFPDFYSPTYSKSIS